MLIPTTREIVDHEIARLSRSFCPELRFAKSLEERFEATTARERAYRLWLDGLIAIVVLNVCLGVDYLLVKDGAMATVVRQMMLVTPLALGVNWLMRWNPPLRIREASVALGTTVICFLALHAQRGRPPAAAIFGLMCVMIAVSFVNVVMRLRQRYAWAATVIMLAGGVWFAWHASGLAAAEKVVGVSVMGVGVIITLTAGYSLERQERLGYLLLVRSELHGVELHRLSNMDKLTELPNRRAFEEHFEALWAEAVRERTPLSAILIDIDHFKVANDAYGHLYGDEVLKRIAMLLPQALRTQEDIVARFGGEEFVILLPGLRAEHAMLVAERVRSLVEMVGTPVAGQATGRKALFSTVSCGVSTCVPDARRSRERFLRSADRALYRAKANGRNRVEFQEYDASLGTEIGVILPQMVETLEPIEGRG
jgi:diguanylate cyclase (GGDEF)-like protein